MLPGGATAGLCTCAWFRDGHCQGRACCCQGASGETGTTGSAEGSGEAGTVSPLCTTGLAGEGASTRLSATVASLLLASPLIRSAEAGIKAAETAACKTAAMSVALW